MRFRLLFGGLVLLVLVLGFELYLSQGGLSGPVREMAAKAARERFGREVTMERVRLSLFPPSVKAEGVVLPPVGEAFSGGTIASLRIRLTAASLLTGGLRALDIKGKGADLGFRLPAPEGPPGKAAAPPAMPELPLEAWGLHRVYLADSRVSVFRGERRFAATGITLSVEPDVTLRRLLVELDTGALQVEDRDLAHATHLELELRPDRLRVSEGRVEGMGGVLELSGDVRAEPPPGAGPGAAPVATLGMRTEFTGSAPQAVELARRFGFPAPDMEGEISASGRLYGPVNDLHWDGEVTGRDVGMPGQPRRLPEASVRLRADSGQVEVVYARVHAGGGEVRASGTLDLAASLAYRLDVRAEGVSVAWLLDTGAPLGDLSGAGWVEGRKGMRPHGAFDWLYRNPQPGGADPDGVHAPLWRRFAARLSEGSGSAAVGADGGQSHRFSIATPVSRTNGTVEVTPAGGLSGTLEAESGDFADLGGLIGLPYVHGRARARGTLGGTLGDFRVRADARLSGGRIRRLGVTRLTGEVTVRPHGLSFRHARYEGQGTVRLDGELRFPPPERRAEGIGVDLAADVRGVPLDRLVELFHTDGPLELNFPASGRMHVLTRSGRVAVWGTVTGGEGSLYGQRLTDSRGRVWIDHEGMTLTGARFGVPVEARRVEARGDGRLRWKDGVYRVEMETGGLPLEAVDTLRETVPFLTGVFDGGGTLEGNFEDPDLRLSGRLTGGTFYGEAVGDLEGQLALSRWQLRVLATLKDADGAETARVRYYSRLQGDTPFAMAARLNGADAVPWIRGLLPEVDELARGELGADYGLTGWGRVAAAGTLRGGPEQLRVAAERLRVTSGDMQAALAGPARLGLQGDTLVLSPFRFSGEGLDLTVAGTLVPDASYGLAVYGRAEAAWIDHVRPVYGVQGGKVAFDVALGGGWDVPWVRGEVRPDALVVADPDLAAYGIVLTLTGAVQVAGPLEEPGLGDVSATFSPFAATVRDQRLSTPRLSFSGVRGRYTLEGTELAGRVGRVRLEGGWDYLKEVRLRAVGTALMSELVRMVDGVERGTGEVELSGEMSGPWESPRMRGGATMEGGELYIAALGQTLRVDEAGVLYDSGRLVIDTLEGDLGGGRVAAQGVYREEEGDVQLIATLDGYTVRPIPGLSATVSGELALSGRLPAPTLSGDLHVSKALYDRNMKWSAWLVDAVAGGGEEVSEASPLGEVGLAVRLYGSEGLLVDNNVARLALDMDLAVGGSVADPTLLGRVDVQNGEIYFRDHTFEVIHASLDFLKADRIDPYIDVLARTTVEHALPDDPLNTEPIEVDMSLAGTMEQLDFTLTSRPDLPQNDLLSLLAVGRTTEELAGAGSGLGMGEAADLVTSPLQSELEQRVNRITGLDRFQVDPFYSEDTASGGARLTLGKTLLDGRGHVLYSTVTDSTQEPVVQFSYRLSPRTSVLVEQDEQGRKGGALRFRIRFR